METGWGTVLNQTAFHAVAYTRQQGLEASARGLLAKNNHFKTQSLSPWFINRNSPVYPWDGHGALGVTSICAPSASPQRTSKTSKIRPELCADAWPFVSAVSLLVTDGDAVLVNLLPSRWHAICLHPDSERRDSSCPSSNWQQGAVFTFDRAKKH